jgi:Sporulation related domain.
MIELAQHIETLLLENDCVIVPGFGGFVAHYSPATRVKEENIFLPPTRTIGFNPQLKLNDGVLVQSYMSAYDTSFADASRIVEKEVNEFIGLLHEEGKAHLDNIGEIHYNIYGNYEFVPYDYKITTPSLYGLDSFEIHELSALQQKEKVLIPTYPEKEKKTFEISINRAYLRNAAAMIAAIVLFFAFSTPVENTDVQKNNYAQLLPSELFEQIEKQSVAITPVYVKNDAAQQAKKFSASSASTKTSSAKKHTTDKAKTSKPIAVREVKVVKQETAAPAPAVKSQESANHPFHIIVAGGISLKDAEAIATQLKSKGFADAKALNTDDKVRVSISSFNNRDEATKQLLELRKTKLIRMPGYWLNKNPFKKHETSSLS